MRFTQCRAITLMACAASVALGGCGQEMAEPTVSAQSSRAAASQPAIPRADTCEAQHPYPCGGEWPEGLTAEFELDRVDEVQLTAPDGTVLAGWVAFPKVPESMKGLRLPTILSSSPYYDSIYQARLYTSPASDIDWPLRPSGIDEPPGGTDEALGHGWWDDEDSPGFDVVTHSAGFAPIRLLRRGYALAYFSVRGTGASGGCFGWGDRDDRFDQRMIIDWIAEQDWSNGRVGMVGLSAPSYSSWQAAIDAPDALKTIVTAGDMIDLYQFFHTPQGSRALAADALVGGVFEPEVVMTGGNAQADRVEGRPNPVLRAGCMPWNLLVQQTASLATGDRNAAFWLERPQSTQLDRVRAAVLDTAGYHEVLAHPMQNAMVWGSLPRETPRVQILGWWGHDYPRPHNAWGTTLWKETPDSEDPVAWEGYVTRWFDYWLKGIGPEPRTGVVYHQDQTLKWHEATHWSPAPSKKEVLYLAPQALDTRPGTRATTFRSAPHPLDLAWSEKAIGIAVGGDESEDAGMSAVLCPSPADASLSHVYRTSPLEAPVLIAGNPFAYLKLLSDQPGGLVTVTLYDLAPEFACTDSPGGGARYTGARYIASGSADLEFYSTPYLAHDFPVATPVELRIDLIDITYLLQPGHQLALAVSSGAPFERGGSKYTPTITIDGSSEIILPVVEGTLGGQKARKKYPQRPFTPEGYED